MQPMPPCSVPAGWWWLWVLGVAVRHLICGFYLFIFPLSYVALWDFKTLHRPTGESVSWCLETSPLLRLPFLGQISVLSSFVSLFIFYILFYLISKTMGCLSACLMFSAIIWKLFCGIFSAFKCSFDEFMRDKVVSPSYSSAILGSPLQRSHLHSHSTQKHDYIKWTQTCLLHLTG